jgi:hypothetical protein
MGAELIRHCAKTRTGSGGGCTSKMACPGDSMHVANAVTSSSSVYAPSPTAVSADTAALRDCLADEDEDDEDEDGDDDEDDGKADEVRGDDDEDEDDDDDDESSGTACGDAFLLPLLPVRSETRKT